MSIPKQIYQTFFKRTGLHPKIEDNIASLVVKNPGWTHNFYTDDDCVEFIKQHYGQEMLDTYNLINPSYGAARSDLFRYLLIYAVGGVYLDIKSSVIMPLDKLTANSEYILSHWADVPKGMFDGDAPENGEFQQWHVIAAPKHPFLEAVIERVVRNIHDPANRELSGKMGVIRLTGPVPYTLAILPILHKHPYTRYRTDNDAGLVYTIMPGGHTGHFFLYNNKDNVHYSRFSHPIIGNAEPVRKQHWIVDTAYAIYEKALKRKLEAASA
jgi:mannosyltransferase OCH1-like enzyme